MSNEANKREEEPFLDDPEAIDGAEDIDLMFEDGDEASAAGAAPAAGEETAALKAEVAELKDRLLRALADVENIRKRADRERRDAELYGGTRLARDVLPVYDNFTRALETAGEQARKAAPALFEGIELTQRELIAAFERNRIVKVEPEKGERFDPKLHQAMFEAPVPGTKAGEIFQVVGVGFTIGDRLLRPAQVGVSSGGPAVPASQTAAGDDAKPD